MAIWKVAPGLAAGCTLILKPAEQTPLTALRLGELALEAGFPEGALNVLTGDGETGAALVDHPDVDKVAFTGSVPVGREIGAKCGRALKRVTLELGGKSPDIILPDADLDAASRASSGIYSNTGQACNAASRLSCTPACSTRWSTRWPPSRARPRSAPGSTPTPSSARHQRGAARPRERLHRRRRSEGAEPWSAAARRGATATAAATSCPTLFTGVADEMKIAREEIFGPVLVAMPFDDLRRSPPRQRHRVRAGRGPLDPRRLAGPQAGRHAEGGSVYINTWGGGDPAAPFSGYKASGIGREKGHHNLDAYLEAKMV